MTSILISSDDPQISMDIGHQLADADGYRYVGRDLLSSVATQYDFAEEKLTMALDGTGGRKLSKRQRIHLLSHIQAATLQELSADNVVCVGLAAHLYVKGVSHVLRLRVLANPEERLAAVAQQQGLSSRKARKFIEKEQVSCARWSTVFFCASEADPAIYDIVVQLKQINAERVKQIVRDMAGLRGFQTMTYSRKCLDDLLMASQVRSELLPVYRDIRVSADGDRVVVQVKCAKRKRLQVASEIKKSAGGIRNVGLVEVHAVSSLRDAQEVGEIPPQAFVNGD